MALYIEIVPTYSKHFLSVVVFVDLRIFASRMAHVYVMSPAFHLKKRALIQTLSFSI